MNRALICALAASLIFAAGCGTSARRAEGPARLFILAGQSNMNGAGKVAHLFKEQRVTPENVRFWENGEFRELVYGNTFGPEVGFVDALKKAGVKGTIIVFKFARGGTHLHGQWDPAVPPENTKDERGALYQRMLADLTALRKALAGDGVEPVISGFLWMQGERDCRGKEMAANYQRNLHNLIACLRRDTEVPYLPAFVGRIAPRMLVVDLGPCVRIHTYREKVRAAQVAVAARDPRVEWIDTDDLPQFDNLHYDAAGQMALGRRFGRAWLRMTNVR